MLALFFILLKREWLLCRRHRAEVLLPCLFFVLIACFFPLAITADPQLLMKIGVGAIWVSILLAIFMTLPTVFLRDYDDGSLDQLLLLPLPLSWIISAKMLVHWAAVMLPMLIIVPIVGSMYRLNVDVNEALMLSLLLSTPSLFLLGGLLSALTVGLRQQGLLLALLIFPLYVPILIFSTSMITGPIESRHAAMALLSAILVISITLLPMAIAATLRVGLGSGESS